MFSTPPWRRYSKAWASVAAGALESSASSASGSASPPSSSSATPSRAQRDAQRGDALRPRPAAAEQADDDDARPVEQVVEERVDVLDAVGLAQRTGPKPSGRSRTA